MSNQLHEIHYRILKYLQDNPEVSQRQLARDLGVSLGKLNYCLNALVTKGSIKIKNFKNSQNKLAYAYLLTPNGVSSKARLGVHFLQQKLAELEAIKQDIHELRAELKYGSGAGKSQAHVGDARDSIS